MPEFISLIYPIVGPVLAVIGGVLMLRDLINGQISIAGKLGAFLYLFDVTFFNLMVIICN